LAGVVWYMVNVMLDNWNMTKYVHTLTRFSLFWRFWRLFMRVKQRCNIWAASWQNQHNGFATSMDPDQLAHPRILIRIMLFAISFSTCKRVGKRTAWILVRLRGCAGWSGSMLVTKTLCWVCSDAAHFLFI
jgi:hypothetical protein